MQTFGPGSENITGTTYIWDIWPNNHFLSNEMSEKKAQLQVCQKQISHSYDRRC